VPSLHLQNGFGTDWISSTLIADVGSRSAREISGSLSRRGIGSRRWWEDGCHRHPAYRDLQALPCSVTEDLADRLIGLPFFVDITPPEVEETAAALANMLTDNI
jgi:dTDP-4-amino-4,6-dideoxygalactose transaminase